MLNSNDLFMIGLIFIASPFLVFFVETIFNMGFDSNPYIASLIGTIGVLFLVASLIR